MVLTDFSLTGRRQKSKQTVKGSTNVEARGFFKIFVCKETHKDPISKEIVQDNIIYPNNTFWVTKVYAYFLFLWTVSKEKIK